MMKVMAKLCKELKHELKEVLREVNESMEKDRNEGRGGCCEIRTSMDFINKVLEDMRSTLDVVRGETAELKKEKPKLEFLCENLSKRVSDCECRLMQAEQYSRYVNIEIKGTVTQKHKDLVDVLKSVGEVIEEPIQKSDVEVCHRVAVPRSDAKNITVQFVSRKKRSDAV